MGECRVTVVDAIRKKILISVTMSFLLLGDGGVLSI